MLPHLLAFLLILLHLVNSLEPLPPIHYTISRRGGSFAAPDTVNLTYLLSEIHQVEYRLRTTIRDYGGNRVTRKPKRVRGTQANTVLLGDVGREGNWFAHLHIGNPAQQVDLDMDMLSADFYILSTKSNLGSFYLDYDSNSYVDSEHPLAFPTCRHPTDVIHLPTIQRVVPVAFAHCRPAKQWIRSLLPNGAYLGLAPSSSLSQTKTTSLMPQVMEKNIISVPVWSLILLNGQDGVFTIGGTSVASVRQRERESDQALAGISHEDLKRREKRLVDDWKWSNVHGTEGWWQILMPAIWVGGVRTLENQQIVLDLNTPFIMAPPVAARIFYSSISGSRRLPPPYDQFHAYPCFSPPKIHFEFTGRKFHVLKGKRDKGTFSPGGRFSLGRMAIGSGYCIGIVVESRTGSGDVEDSGLAEVWIVGEPFFRDVEVVFDWKEKRVGMQRA